MCTEARPLLVQQLGGFLRTGTLAFGGGHMVLPLLEQAQVPNFWIDLQQFLAGYWAAQAVPRPMFSFAAFVGFDLQPELQGIAGSDGPHRSFFSSFLLIVGLFPSGVTWADWLQCVEPCWASMHLWWACCWQRCFSPSGKGESGVAVSSALRWWRLFYW